jgi:hypothetical protein
MNPRVKSVVPMPNYMLSLTFANDVQKEFDMKPYLTKGIFIELKNENIFNTAHVSFGTVTWSNGADLCPDTFYEGSK